MFCYLKCQHTSINLIPLCLICEHYRLFTAHHYVFLICYSSDRKHPGVTPCPTAERASEDAKVDAHTHTHTQTSATISSFPAQGPFKEPLITRQPVTSIQPQSSQHTCLRKLTIDFNQKPCFSKSDSVCFCIQITSCVAHVFGRCVLIPARHIPQGYVVCLDEARGPVTQR